MQGLLDGSQIAVFYDADGNLAAPPLAREVVIYVRDNGDWSEDRRHAFALPRDAGLAELREEVHGLADSLENCRIMVGLEDNGAPYGILDKLGFYICMMDKFDLRALEGVRDGVLAALQAPAPSCRGSRPAVSRPREIAPARYFLDMVEAKETDPMFTAREAILVFVETTPFIQLQIKCEHEPRWLAGFTTVAGLEVEREDLESGLRLLTVRHPAGRDIATLTGRKWFDGGGCASCG